MISIIDMFSRFGTIPACVKRDVSDGQTRWTSCDNRAMDYIISRGENGLQQSAMYSTWQLERH